MATHPLIAIKRRYARAFLRLLGVVGVAVGRQDPTRDDSPLSMVLYVLDQSAANRLGALPRVRGVARELEALGYSLKLIVSGPLVATGDASQGELSAASSRDRVRPVQAGVSVGTLSSGGSGTAGLVVTDAATGRACLLGNAHVLNGGNDDAEQVVVQPGAADGGGADDRVGALLRSVKLLAGRQNTVDAALVALDADVETAAAAAGICDGYGLGLAAVKVGRTTGTVRGVVQSIDADVKVTYDFGGELELIEFVGQTVFAAHAEDGAARVQEPGDSGSVWVSETDGRAVAVSFAAASGGALSIGSPAVWAAQILGFTVPGVDSTDADPVEDDGPRVEPLDDDAVAFARQRVITAGEPWRDLVADVDEDDGLDLATETDATLEGAPTQLTGDANGVTIYQLLVKTPNWGPWGFAWVVCVGAAPPAGAPGVTKKRYGTVGEYWWWGPGAAYYLTDEDAEVSFEVKYSGQWSGSIGQDTVYAYTNMIWTSNLRFGAISVLNPAGWSSVSAPTTTSAFSGVVTYDDATQTQITQTIGVRFNLITYTDAADNKNKAALTSVNWYQESASAPTTGFFPGAQTGYTSQELSQGTLGAAAENKAWYGWPYEG